jgi:hypothetical protein
MKRNSPYAIFVCLSVGLFLFGQAFAGGDQPVEQRKEFQRVIKEKRFHLKEKFFQFFQAYMNPDMPEWMEARFSGEALRNIRERLRAESERFFENAEKRRELLQRKFDEKRSKKIETYFNAMMGRFERAFELLADSEDRIRMKIDRMKVRGSDVADIETKLAQAKLDISSAEAALAKAREVYEQAIASENVKESFVNVEVVVGDVKEKVKIAHQALVDVLASVEMLENASSTVESAMNASSSFSQ